MKILISCQDKYEAQKLSSLIYIKDSKETFIREILFVNENEIVVYLRDKSAHSVLLKNEDEVEKFTDFMQSIFEKQHKIFELSVCEDTVEILKG